jgi:hypothetical protein
MLLYRQLPLLLQLQNHPFLQFRLVNYLYVVLHQLLRLNLLFRFVQQLLDYLHYRLHQSLLSLHYLGNNHHRHHRQRMLHLNLLLLMVLLHLQVHLLILVMFLYYCYCLCLLLLRHLLLNLRLLGVLY